MNKEKIEFNELLIRCIKNEDRKRELREEIERWQNEDR